MPSSKQWVLVVAGTLEQFERYVLLKQHATVKPGLGVATYRGTTFQAVLRPELIWSHDQSTKVILTGTYWNHSWIHQIYDQFKEVHHDPL
jgi:hypothetical protein